jgi:hypothetical protein
VKIELLYFDGCHNHEAVVDRLYELLDQSDRSPTLVLRRIPDDAAAQQERFLGSPTVRVNGRDIEPGADQRNDYGVKCRLYATSEGLVGVPPDEWLLSALAGQRLSAAMRAEGLSGAERQLHRRVLRELASGGVPNAQHLDGWARELRLDPDQAIAALAHLDLVHLDVPRGAVTVGYPFSATPTRHRVRVGSGADVFAMCAIDALGIAFMLREPTEITSADPDTGEPITVSIRLTDESTWSPRDAVVVAGHMGTGTSRACTCPYTNFAASPKRAHALLEAEPVLAGDILSMPEAIVTGRESFGSLLDHQADADGDADRA